MSSNSDVDDPGHTHDGDATRTTDERLRDLLGSSARGVADPATYSSLAELQMDHGTVSDAVVTLDRGLRFAGAHAPLLLARGRALARLDRHGEALEAFDWALAIDSDLSAATIEGANSLGQLGRYEECLERIEPVLDRLPDNVEALYVKAEALRLLGRGRDALSVTRKLLDEYPRDRDLSRQYTLILRGEDEPAAALAAADDWIAAAPDDSSAHVTKAELLVEEGRYEEGIAAFDAALEADRNDISALLGKSDSLDHLEIAGEERHRQQLTLVEEALEIDPRHPTALRQRAWLLWALDRNADAVAAVKRIVDSEGSDPWLLGLYGDAQTDAGHWGEAVYAYDELAESEGLETFALLRLGRYGTALRTLGRVDDARRVFDVALDKEPRDGAILAGSAEVHRLMSDDEAALAQLDQALEVGYRDEFVLGTRGEVLNALGRFEEALPALDEALTISDRQAWIHTAHGEALRNLDRPSEAIEAFDRALELAPGDPEIRSLKSEALRLNGNPREAIELADALLAEYPDHTFTIGTQAAALNDVARYEDGLAAIEPVLDELPDYVFGWSVKTEALMRLDRHAEAHAAVDTLLLVEPGHVWGQLVKAQLFVEQGRYADALAHLERAATVIEPDNEFHLLEGTALGRLGRLDEAIDRLTTANEEGSTISILSELADVVALSQQNDRAVAYRRQALALLPDDQPPQASDLARAAWCQFHLGDLEATVRHYLKATSLDSFVIEWQFELAMAEFKAGQRSVASEQLDSWRQAVAACPDPTRAAGIARECRESFRRAELFGLFESLDRADLEELQNAVKTAEHMYPVYPNTSAEVRTGGGLR